MTQSVFAQDFGNDVKKLRICAKKLDLSDHEISRIFRECFTVLKNEKNGSKCTQRPSITAILTRLFIILPAIIMCMYILLNVHQPTSSIVLRNVQGLIYPGLKFLRAFAVPVVRKFPSLTGLYDESCLLENPFFYVSDMECWPCQNVHSVIDLTGFNNHTLYQSGTPYIVKTNQPVVTVASFRTFYNQYRAVLSPEILAITTNDPTIKSLDGVLDSEIRETAHISWRINRMLPARLIRRIFPKPFIISEWSGQSIERYVMLDGSKSGAYPLPNTECSYIFLIQSSGERTIILKPSRECGDTCRTVSVVLKPSYVLWYNWWYWRPISLPSDNSTETSISYISSYC